MEVSLKKSLSVFVAVVIIPRTCNDLTSFEVRIKFISPYLPDF